MTNQENKTVRNDNLIVLITGGAGFLGKAIVNELFHPEHSGIIPPSEIRIFDPKPVDTTDRPSVIPIQGDIRSYEDVLKACEDVDIVIHSASIVDWGRVPDTILNDVNIKGTENVIRACQEAGVRGLIYTSTMDVVYTGRPIVNGDESLPYPDSYSLGYARTKAVAEQTVIKANGTPRTLRKDETGGKHELHTCVIRPCGMYGEADPYHLTETLKMVQTGKLKYRIGDGRAVFQHVYVGNVAHGHVLAAKHLLSEKPDVAGEVYLITDTPAENFFDFLEPICTQLGHPLPSKSKSIPFTFMLFLGTVLEGISFLVRPFYKLVPVVTRTSVRMVCKDLCFSGEKAVRELGYQPVYSKEESIERTVRYFKKHGPVT